MTVLNPTPGSPPGDPTKRRGAPRNLTWKPPGFDYRTSTGLGETETPLLRAQQNFVCTKTQTKGAVTPQETEPKPPASTGGSPVEAWIDRGSAQGQGTGGSPMEAWIGKGSPQGRGAGESPVEAWIDRGSAQGQGAGDSPVEAWTSRGSAQAQDTGGSPWRPGSAGAQHRHRALEGLQGGLDQQGSPQGQGAGSCSPRSSPFM